MREWHLKLGDPLCLTLAADARLGPIRYHNDQIWELQLSGGDPPAVALQTTYGLRARLLRLFPRFIEGDLVRSDPAEFVHLPMVTHFGTSFLVYRFTPLAEIEVVCEAWVPQSQGLVGRIQVTNIATTPRQIRLEWVAQLTPTTGQRMAAAELQAAPLLLGQTDEIFPVVFLTGGPQPGSGSYPSLAIGLDLEPGETRQFTWAQAALDQAEASFNMARELAARRLPAERARLEIINGGQIDIYTGNSDWDAAFALAQKTAFSLFSGPTAQLPERSFVLTRQPDQGYSLRGDGSDYNHLWNGQSPLDAWYLAQLVLPAHPELMEGLVQNYLSTRLEDGFIDWRPGLAGQRSRLLATPLLSTLTWKTYEISRRRPFLEACFPGLLAFLQCWFNNQHDRDGDGVPEWDHPMQAGMDDHPVYSRWQPWSQGVDISTAESVALCSFLVKEIYSLERIAAVLDQKEAVLPLLERAERLCTAVEAAWHSQEACYQDWDRDTHASSYWEDLGQRLGSGEIFVQRTFDPPVRLLVRIRTSGESTRRPQMIVYGLNISGMRRVERIGDERFKWYLGTGSLTVDRPYAAIDRIEIQGLEAEDQVDLYRVGYHSLHQSVLLPLWAGIPDAKRGSAMVAETILQPQRFWRPYGLPACIDTLAGPEHEVNQQVNLEWNCLIGEGLVQYGYRNEAADLVGRLMSGVVGSLKKNGAFYRAYHAETGQGMGERNVLSGLAPVGLFLETLGVRLYSSRRVGLVGFNPYPWPVTVKYRGISVLRQKERSMVIFPDGQTVVVDDPAPRIVALTD